MTFRSWPVAVASLTRNDAVAGSTVACNENQTSTCTEINSIGQGTHASMLVSQSKLLDSMSAETGEVS